VTLTKTQGAILEQSITWAVDSIIKVLSGHRTTANLVITEQEFDGSFSVRSEFSGKVLVLVTNTRDNNSLVMPIAGDLDQIIKWAAEEKELKGFQVDKGIVSFETNGSCSFRFGIQQNVEINQEKL